MQTLRILLGLIVILLVVFTVKQYFSPVSKSPAKQNVTSKKVVVSPAPTGVPSPTRGQSVTLKEAPTDTPVPPTSTPVPQPTSSSLSPYRYPNAAVTSQSSTEIAMTSGDSAQAITNWYKSRISSQGLNTTSFVQTSSNDNILNKLAAGLPNDGQLTVTITKPASATSVSIDVTISHS